MHDIVSKNHTLARQAISYIRNPLSVLMGWAIGKLVVDCQQPKTDQDGNVIDYTPFHNITNASGMTTKYAYYETGNKDAKGVFVYFSGNAAQLDKSREWMQTDAFKAKYKYVFSVFHPKNVTTLKTEIDAGEELIKHLIQNQRVNASDITVSGWSLGGGISAQVLDRFRTNGVLKDGESFERYISYQSFTSLSDTVAGFVCENRERLGFKILSYILGAILNFCGMELDTLSVLRKPDLPVKEVSIAYDDFDDLMNTQVNALTKSIVGVEAFNYASFFGEGHGYTDENANPGIAYKTIERNAFVSKPMTIGQKACEFASSVFTLSNWTSLNIVQEGLAKMHDSVMSLKREPAKNVVKA